jgi:hypothetical protein
MHALGVLSKHLAALVATVVLGFTAVSAPVLAAKITDRSLTITDSTPGADNVNYTFNFTVPSGDVIKSFSARVCNSGYNACTTPDGFDAGSATLLSQPDGFGNPIGWSADNSDPGQLRMSNDTNATPPGSSQSVTFRGVTNPSDTNTTYFARISTYGNADFTNPIDTGVVTFATAEAVQVAADVPPILNFCVGNRIPGDCASATGNSLDLGQFSAGETSVATSQFRANTNYGNGYAVTVRGTTMTSGTNSIPALSSQTASTPGTGQFGMNLRDNTNPDVGADPTGPGVGTAHPNYNAADQFRFASGDVVARSAEETRPNTYTASYIVNVPPDQAKGTYSTTLTYICTATF